MTKTYDGYITVQKILVLKKTEELLYFLNVHHALHVDFFQLLQF